MFGVYSFFRMTREIALTLTKKKEGKGGLVEDSNYLVFNADLELIGETWDGI